MARYNLLQDFTDSSDGRIQQDPYWIIAVVRYFYPLTFSRDQLVDAVDDSEISVSWPGGKGATTNTKELMIISHDCKQLEISSTKNSHIVSLQAVLANSHTNYLSEVMPGDWIMAWIVNSRSQYLKTLKKIKSLDPANSIEDGFKFLGRVHDIRKTLVQSPDGPRNVTYQLQAVGFEELDSEIFYDPALQINAPSIGQYLSNFIGSLSDIFNTAAGGIDSNLAIPVLIKALIGKGISDKFANLGGLPLVTGLVATDDAPFAYVVPNEIGNLLGVQVKSKEHGVFSYADLLDVTIGVQKYSATTIPQMFFPDGTDPNLVTVPDQWQKEATTNRHFTDTPLKGIFQPTPISFDRKSIWTLLNEYLNPSVNEMYTCFKLCPSGKVMPALIVRQLPFNTPTVKQKLDKTLGITSFIEVPRWFAPSILIKSMDIGRSNALRFNFLHVYGQSSIDAGNSITRQMVRNPPFRDEDDIKRNGLKLYMMTTNCSLEDTFGGPRKWMTILSDFLMGQYLTLNGTCSLTGVASPIVPGDNFEFDDVVYHIEAVAHRCSVSPDGRNRSFNTNLMLSHGIRSDIPVAADRVPKKHSATNPNAPLPRAGDLSEFQLPLITTIEDSNSGTFDITDDFQNPDLYIYSGVTEGDNTDFDPGLVTESDDD